ncbi:MAG TPA: saccharopine dehydrogenase C-terminal domain-containing protein [Candidatus Paceibacterota bacterium]|nr:saccharopine dehydrogenase C-terminal domain-containing protein [Candidatus Paceibacterota bacterium]
MGKYRYLVLGTGVGKAIAWWLARQEDTEHVMLTDISEERAFSVADDIRPGKEHRRVSVRARALNVEQGNLHDVFGPHDVIISALPAKYSMWLAQNAMECGRHFCELGGVVPVTRDMLGMHALAEGFGVSIIPDCGLMPGLGVVMAQDLLDRLNTTAAKKVVIAAGGLPQKPEEPSNYQLIYSAEGLEHMCYDPAPVVRDRKVVEINPFDVIHRFPLQELTDVCPQFMSVEAFSSSGASVAPWNFAAQGVYRFDELTLRWPGFVDTFQGLSREQFREVIERLPRTDHAHPDVAFMRVTAETLSGEYLSYRLLDRFDPRSGLSAMERTTGFSAAALARMQAQGRTLNGVLTPEKALNADRRKEYLTEVGRWINIRADLG